MAVSRRGCRREDLGPGTNWLCLEEEGPSWCFHEHEALFSPMLVLTARSWAFWICMILATTTRIRQQVTVALTFDAASRGVEIC